MTIVSVWEKMLQHHSLPRAVNEHPDPEAERKKARRMPGLQDGNGAQTTAPAFGSLGSSFLWMLPLTRSSRLMPSHIAMAAATKQDE